MNDQLWLHMVCFYVCVSSFFIDKPTCSNYRRMVQGVARGHETRIVCPVSAHPQPNTFSWAFNSSSEMETVMILERF